MISSRTLSELTQHQGFPKFSRSGHNSVFALWRLGLPGSASGRPPNQPGCFPGPPLRGQAVASL